MSRGRIFPEPNKVNDLENTERVNEEKGDEPPLLAAACGVPQCVSFNDNGPKGDKHQERKKREHKRRCERGIERVVVHMGGFYHTLVV